MFQEIMSQNINFLFDLTTKTPSIASISQYFFSNTTVTAGFSGLMLRFLVDNLEQLGGPDQARSALLFKHFKLVFMAVTLFPDQNEVVLKAHLANIIMSSLKLSAKSKDSLNFFLLLRALFRNIGGGRFEALYQEVLPLLQVLLENLNSLVASSHTTQMRELFVELCLTVFAFNFRSLSDLAYCFHTYHT
jgi:transformation/transcription domain-associated protein